MRKLGAGKEGLATREGETGKGAVVKMSKTTDLEEISVLAFIICHVGDINT